MAFNDTIGNRMKLYYEDVFKNRLIRRMPVAIRIDGKAFHTFTRGFEKPFDRVLMDSMQETMKYLCEKIQGCVFGYTQSDDITLILTDYEKLTTSAWFDYEVQKMCSISASMATMSFNRFFAINANACDHPDVYEKALCNGAMFDARVFNIPKEEVCNLIYWRQLDASRNSVSMVGRAYFKHKELMNKSTEMVQEMLYESYGINWNDYSSDEKRGSACYKVAYIDKESGVERNKWIVDKNMPLLKIVDDTNNREYVEKWIYREE